MIDIFGAQFQGSDSEKTEFIECVDSLSQNKLPTGSLSPSDVDLVKDMMAITAASNGTYDSTYLYITDSAVSLDDICKLCTQYNISHITNDNVISLAMKNSKIVVAKQGDIMEGNYDYIEADMIIMNLNYEDYNKQTLIDIDDKLSSLLNYNGIVQAWITDFDIVSNSSPSTVDGDMFRMHDNTLQVKVDGDWKNLDPNK